ncbi:hypothetical protein E2C01_101892 [Portunus trituberculatus]|uniref:Uncharacterized protein n=1 Tax=Portunus trituberculatus TaxID=210409 RepID=A0A5B7KGZ0_PORTR|nr:hypothetical protein [Portunus trituberculatus]
MVPLYHGV